jgi:hypothetical protein
MFNSKALKPFKDKPNSFWNKVNLWWYNSWLGKNFYDYKWKLIEAPIYHVKRLIEWQWNVFRFDYDFAGHCLFAIIEYKLKRLEKVLINGHAIQEDQDMKALKVAIKLAGRLKEDKYSDSFYRRHDKKWGEMKHWFTDVDSNDRTKGSLWNHSRPNANTQEEKDQESKEHLANCYAAEDKTKREERWLYDILHKYLRRWWD